MWVRLVGSLVLAASAVDASVTAHEFLKTMHSAKAAVMAGRLMPLDADNDLRAAADATASAADSAADDTTASDEHLRAALAKDPYNTRGWIELSVHAELRGDASSAERALKQAAAHDIGREPKWALANFYFRQHDTAHLIEWVNRYRTVTHDREDGLFRLISQVEPDGATWPDRLPHLDCGELKTAVDVLGTDSHGGDALVDRMTSTCRDEASTKELSQLVSRLLMKDQVTRAGEIWHEMGRPVTFDNADFSQPVTGEGFDWRVNQSPDVEVHAQAGEGLSFDLEDNVMDGTVLLFQPVPLEPGAHYRIAMKSHSEPAGDGAFRWELVELSTGRHLPSDLDVDDDGGQPSWEFRAPLQITKTVALALYYRRPSGAAPFTGQLTVGGLQLSRQLVATASARHL